MARILLINGPNLNLLGRREPETYGATTLGEIEQAVTETARGLGHELETFQSNAESAILEAVHAAAGRIGFIIINPGAYTHTSIALRDALLGVAIPFIEVHLSNVHAREPFRHKSYLSDIAFGVITGLGADGYHYAVQAAARALASDPA